MMKHILLFEGFSKTNIPTDLMDMARGIEYDDFVENSDNSRYKIIYRGMDDQDELTDNSFFAEWPGHAREYGEYVDGLLITDDIMDFDNRAFNYFRHTGFDKLFSLPRDIDYDEEEGKIKKMIAKVYAPFFMEDKLGDAMYHFNYDEDKVIDYVYKTVIDSIERYEDISKTKKNDFLIPLLTHYAKSVGKNIISFWGSDYEMAGGAEEYVVSDVSRYVRLSEIWEMANDSPVS